MNPELAAALARMDAAVGRLESTVARHLDTDTRRSDLEIELQVMADDRGRLATELESASARVQQLETASDHVGLRLDAAIGTIRTVLGGAPGAAPVAG